VAHARNPSRHHEDLRQKKQDAISKIPDTKKGLAEWLKW
jgi:hypothetical protein